MIEETSVEKPNLFQRTNRTRQAALSAGIAGVIALGGLVLANLGKPTSTTPPPPARTDAIAVSQAGRQVLQIETAKIRTEAIDSRLQAPGLVLSPADQTIKISPRLQGRIRQVLVGVGDRVRAGQALATLDSVDAASAQTSERQTQNKLRLARVNLARQERLYRLGTSDVTSAQANVDQAKARTLFTKEALRRVREQAGIGGFTQKPVEDAETAVVGAKADLASTQADLAQAQRDRDRKSKLVEIGVAAKQDLEAAENAVQKAQVTMQANQDKVRLTQQSLERERKAFRANLYSDQAVRSAESDYRQAQLQEAAAVRALRLARTAVLRDLQQARSDYLAAQADAENARRLLTLYGHPGEGGLVRITSPIAGILVERNVNPGQIVDQSQMTPWQMFTITNARGRAWVDADVYENDISRIRPGAKVTIHVGALPYRTFSGSVYYIAPGLDPKTHAVKVRTRIANPGGLLKDGMFVNAVIDTGRGRPVPIVPISAVQHEGDSDYAYVAREGRYARRTVHVGPQRGQCYVVKEGLRPGETVVTRGALFLGSQASGS